MSDVIPADELERRWARTLGAGADWERVDPGATQKPVEIAGDLPTSATVAHTLSGTATLGGGTLSGGQTVGGPAAADATLSGSRTIGGASGGDGASGPSPGTGPTLDGGPVAGYELLGEVGRGGMGVVYRARQRSLARDIALKFVRAEQAGQGSRERFVAEALVNGLLDHPNIVPVHELGATGSGEVYLAMKLVGGRSWKALLHPQSPEERAAAASYDLDRHLAVLQGVGNAVAFAHSRGIVHRDLKPENVMVGEFGEVLVMDWGIAVDCRERPDGDRRAQHKSTVTAPSGTPSYMAPELAEGRGRDLGPWTDVYLLGAILHEILTGAPPHRGRTLMEVLLSAAKSEPPRYGPEVPAGLGAIAAQAMSRSHAARHPDVAAFQAAIARYLKNRESERIEQAARERLTAAAAMDSADAAARNRRYGAFAEAVAGFRQALVLWSENAAAAEGERVARIDYAAAALDGGDLGLAEAQLDAVAAEPAAAALAERVAAARREARARESAARRNRWLLGGAAAAIVAGLAIGFALVNAERAQTSQERDRAEQESARAKEAQALAERSAAEAKEARTKADEQRADAVEARRESQARLVGAYRQRAIDDQQGISLLWDIEALRAALGTEQETLQRRRIGAYLQGEPETTRLHVIEGTFDLTDRKRWVSADGRVALVRSFKRIAEIREEPDWYVEIWDLQRMERLVPPIPSAGERDERWSVSRDGTVVLRGTKDRIARVDLRTGRDLPGPAAWGDAGAGVEFAEGEPMSVALPRGAGTVTVPLAGVQPGEFAGYVFKNIAPDGLQAMAYAEQRKRVVLWKLPSGERSAEIEMDGLSDVAWSRSRLALLSSSGHLVVADRATGEILGNAHSIFVPDRWERDELFLVGDDGQRVALSSVLHGDYRLDLIQMGPPDVRELHETMPPQRTLLSRQRLTGMPCGAFPLGPDGVRILCQPETLIAGGRQQSHLMVLDWRLSAEARDASPVPVGTTAWALSADATTLVAATADQLHVRAPDGRKLAEPFPIEAGEVTVVAASADGSRVAVYRDGRYRVHDAKDGRRIGTELVHELMVGETGHVLHPELHLGADGRRLVFGAGGKAGWWEPDTGRGGTLIAGFPLGHHAILGAGNRIIRPWLADDAPVILQVPAGHACIPQDVSPDGRSLLTVTGHQGTPSYARVWDLQSGAPRSPEIRFDQYAMRGVFDPSGKRVVVSVYAAQGMRLFDAGTGAPLSGWMNSGESAHELTFSRDGRLIVAHIYEGEMWADVRTGETIFYRGEGDWRSLGTPRFIDAETLIRPAGDIGRCPQATDAVDRLSARASLLSGWRLDETLTPTRMSPTDHQTAFERLGKDR